MTLLIETIKPTMTIFIDLGFLKLQNNHNFLPQFGNALFNINIKKRLLAKYMVVQYLYIQLYAFGGRELTNNLLH